MRACLATTILAAAVISAAPASAESGAGSVIDDAEEASMGPPGGVDDSPEFGKYTELEHLAEELEQLHRTRPDPFEEVDRVRDAVVAYHRDGAWRPMNVARLLDGIGEDRLLPLLWALVSDDPFELGMGLRAWVAWRVGLLESVGRLRDPRSVPPLLTVAAGEYPQAGIRRAAVAAIGRTGDLEGIEATIEAARQSAERRPAIVAGLGQARRSAAASYLLEIFRTTDDEDLRRTAVSALGEWGNFEAWRTPVLADWKSEGETGRRLIVEALVDVYPKVDSPMQAEITKSLQLVDVHGTEARAGTRAKLSSDDVQEDAWRRLEEAMQRSPLRNRQ